MADDSRPDRPPPRKPGQPLPRMWKSEPEDEEPEVYPTRAQGPGKDANEKPRSKVAKPSKPKEPDRSDGKGTKKVLIEDTPRSDTIEARQRARIIVGSSIVVLIVMLVWITYRAFLYNPTSIEVVEQAGAVETSPEIKPSIDQEARFLYNRAHDLARQNHVDQAIEMLKKVVKVYKGTPTAADAQAALDRPRKNLPLFVEGPSLAASVQPVAAPEGVAEPPPAVVNATPEKTSARQGEVVLQLPANPAEKAMTPPAAGATPSTGTALARPIPAGFKADLSHGVHESGWPYVIVGDRDGAAMVLVPGAIVPMGGDPDSPAGSAVIQARLSTFYIDQHEVTNRQFRTFIRETGYKGQPPGKWLSDEARTEDENRPVVRVNAHDAKAYADWAGKSLPTEAQWELAARSFDGRLHPWGNQPAKWSRPRAFRQVDPVMSFPEDLSPYGAFDMAGNVSEWTRDWFDPRYYRAAANQTIDNPTGPGSRPRLGQLVIKGCSKTFHLGAHDGQTPDKRLPYLGFRTVLALDAHPPGPPGAPAIAQPVQPGAPAATPGQPAPPPVPF